MYVIQVLLYIFQAAERMTIVELTPTEEGDFREQPAPATLQNNQVTLLLPYGSLFFAAARDFEEEAPSADETTGAAVVIILRGRRSMGSTAIGVLERYAQTLQQNRGQLFLADVSEPVYEQLEKTGALETIGPDQIIPADDRLLAATESAYRAAEAWLQQNRSEP